MTDIFSFLPGALSYIVPFVIVLGIVVFVHEFGHFWVARKCGVKIDAFSIGFGPEICAWHDKQGTRWRLAWLPLGGYVKMFGDADPSSFGPDEKVKELSDEEKKVAFYSQNLLKRFAIVAAGPGSNYLFGIVVLAFLYVFAGQPYTSTVVGQVLENSAAAEAGLLVGDQITSIGSETTNSFEDIRRIIALNVGDAVQVTFLRDGKEMSLPVTPKVVKTEDRLGMKHTKGLLGIASGDVKYRELGFLPAMGESVIEVWNITWGTLKGVGQMILGTRGTEELGGPLRIAEMSGKIAQDGFSAFVWFIVVISVNLGLINLFPVPLLDGGHLLFYALEAVRGRPVSDRLQEYAARAGALAVLSLMVFATWNDLVHLKVVSYISGLFS